MKNKEIIISVNPQYLVGILNGDKTRELRLSVPKGFQGWVNLYCTKNGKGLYHDRENKEYFLFANGSNDNSISLNGKIVGRFWFDELDRLTTLGVKWGLSNVLVNKGIHNHHLKKWADKQGYEIIHFEDKTYSALGKGNANTEEVYIVNYDTPFKTFDIFDFM